MSRKEQKKKRLEQVKGRSLALWTGRFLTLDILLVVKYDL